MDSVLESKGKLEDVYVFASPSTQLKNETSQAETQLQCFRTWQLFKLVQKQ